ncbi:MAG: DNA gyrase subunit A [bacterium]|nr:DNA gyrase subunit A [bacterium]
MTVEAASVVPVNIEDSMRGAYLEYAMSVIVGRALPDVRDGLKPVHRRILFAMHDMSLSFNRPYMKSARVVGEVIGKYHPHGDSAVYDAIVRMVQDFSLRNPLIDGQGNFGSVDGDSPAAMRYTEVRLQRISSEFLSDLEKNTVDFTDNYDGSLKEPSVLPTKVPNLLLNGSTGIAVGMATNIPPHNLGELVDALLYFIDNRLTCTVEDLLPIVKGPDFPTGGIIMGREGINSAYKTGKGIIKTRARVEIEEIKGGRQALIITELPYQVNKARLIEKIADLVKDKKLEGIQDLRDESDRRGMRVVIELKRGEIPETVQANLFKHTSMQSTFGVIMLAVVDGQPKTLTLLEVLRHFLSHRIDVVVRRTQFELKKAEDRAHILLGLKKAQENIDAVIQLIRSSPGAKEAKEGLISRFELSDLQAQAILEMRLQRLTAMEVGKLNEELSDLMEKIEYYKKVLADEGMVLNIIREELREIRATYVTDRRTEIGENYEEINQEDLIPVEEMVVTMSRGGYIKRLASNTYKIQHRGGKGKVAMTTKEADDIELLFVASSHDTLLIFSNLGKVYWKRVFELPQASRTAKGRAWINILPLGEDERVVYCMPIQEYSDDQFVLMVTEKGVVKKTELTAYQHARNGGTKAIVIDEGDLLKTVRLCTATDEVFIATKNGMATKFPSEQIRLQGRVTRGCRGINLKEGDEVIGLQVLHGGETILTVTEKGFGKKTQAEEYRLGSRGNMGVMNIKPSPKIGKVVGSVAVEEDDELMLITQRGKIIRLKTGQVRETTRVTMGVRLINLDEGERVVSVAKIDNESEDADS